MAEYLVNLINSYWFWGSAGFITGSALAIRNMVKNGCSFPVAVIALTAGIYAGLLGTRMLYVLIFYPGMFVENPVLALAFWQETGTWLGGPLLGPLGVLLVLWMARQPFLSNMGSAAPGYALAHIIARIGCLMGGCCYGAPTDVPWAIYSGHLQCTVHPTQIYSMIGEAFSLVILQWLWTERKNRIYLFPFYCMILASHRFVSEAFRGTDMGPQLIPGLRVFQTVCVLMFLGALCIVLILKWKKKGLRISLGILAASFLSVLVARFIQADHHVGASKHRGTCLVATRSIFEPSLAPWKDLRIQEGYQVTIQSWEIPPGRDEVKAWILSEPAGNISTVMIVGDCGQDGESASPWHMPSTRHIMTVGQQSMIAMSDTFFGDLDNDGVPDIPVGRLAVRTVADLTVQVDKILAYSRNQATLSRALVWFGADTYTEAMRRMEAPLVSQLPETMDPLVLTGDMRRQSQTFFEQLGAGPALTLIASHGSYRSVTLGHDNNTPIGFSVDDLFRLTSRTPSGPLFMLGCDSGRFAMTQTRGPSLGEALTAHPGGPIAVLAATGPTHPVTNYLMVRALIRSFGTPPGTIGQVLLGIQKDLYAFGHASFRDIGSRDAMAASLLKAVPERERRILSMPGRLEKEIPLYNLLGDPACGFVF